MKRHSRVLIWLLILSFPFAGYSQTVDRAADSTPVVLSDTPRSITVREAAESIRVTRGVPGMAYAVFSKDSIIDFAVLGYRVFKLKDPIEKYDRFNIGTNTTAFTAFIAARLVEAGYLKWTTPLLQIFPSFSSKTLPVYRSIRFQDLLSSRTRVQPFMDMSDWFKIPDNKGDIISKRRAFTYWILQRKPNMENFNQQKIVFSMAGYIMATAMMEKVTGKSWEDLVTLYIRKPMNISMRYSWPNRMDPSAPAGHWFQGGSFHSEDPDTWVKVHPVLYPGQGISISLPDYIKYMQMNLRGLAGVSTKLSREDFEFLFFGLPDFAFGWNNGSYFNQSFAFHEGLSLLFNCRTEILKEKDRCIIVMSNSGDKDGRGAVLDLTKLLEERYF
jgi:CubicO group peptidase (beta-lactamase class C family)